MNAPLYVIPPLPLPMPEPTLPVREVADLLRQLIGLQQEQVGLLKAQIAGQDGASRWRSFLARWDGEFPNLGAVCKQALPVLERAYLEMIRDLTERVKATESGELDNEFALSEFLDRYAMRLGQLGTILSQLGTLAEATPAEEKG